MVFFYADLYNLLTVLDVTQFRTPDSFHMSKRLAHEQKILIQNVSNSHTVEGEKISFQIIIPIIH